MSHRCASKPLLWLLILAIFLHILNLHLDLSGFSVLVSICCSWARQSLTWNRAHGLPRIDMVQNYVRWRWKGVVKEAFFNNFCLLTIFIINSWEFFIVKWNLVAFYEIIIEVDWQDLWVLHRLFGVFWKILVIDIFLRLLTVVRSGRWILIRPLRIWMLRWRAGSGASSFSGFRCWLMWACLGFLTISWRLC